MFFEQVSGMSSGRPLRPHVLSRGWRLTCVGFGAFLPFPSLPVQTGWLGQWGFGEHREVAFFLVWIRVQRGHRSHDTGKVTWCHLP